ncbi:MAG: general secretion pathway protein GspB [Hydrogenophaga sp.]
MSYILDALQRAEAERERGRVPGLKSQLVPPAGRDRARPSALRPWHALVGLAVLLVALGIWWWAGGTDAPAATASAPIAASQPDALNTAPQATPVQPPAPATAPERITAPPEPVQPILAPPRAAPVAAKSAAAATVPAAAPASTTTTAAPPAAAPAPTAAPTATSTAVPTFGELSADARAQLPAVNVSGSTYSQNPALRMLIANGKVVQEGQDIAPGLRLETIGPRSAVLNHQGLRYSIGY